MKCLNRVLVLLAILCGLVYSQTETLSDSDVEGLLSLPYEKAYKLYRGIYVQYVEGPQTDVPARTQRPELYEEASYHFSRNPEVRRYYEEFFKVTPHTIPTARARAKVFRDLNGLKAEWAIRLLAQEMMIDRQGQDLDNGDGPRLTRDDIVYRVNAGRAGDFLRNDRRATHSLRGANLRGMPSYGNFANYDNYYEAMRHWYRDNEHRLPELLAEKWGHEVVLNRDMPGCREPDQPEVVKRDPMKRREAKRGGGRTAQQDEEQASEQEEDGLKIIAWVLGAGVLLVALFLLYRRPTGRGSP